MTSNNNTKLSKKALIINMCGGPGCGKSTGAAYVFSKLKAEGIDCELATEFAKGKTWEFNMRALACQPYLFGEQCWKLDRCADQVDVIITDSPLFLNVIYNKDFEIEPEFSQAVIKKFKSYNNMTFYLNRQWDYKQNGRKESNQEAITIDNEIKALLKKEKIKYSEIDGNTSGYDHIITKILKAIKTKLK